jgi:hypothetical protein
MVSTGKERQARLCHGSMMTLVICCAVGEGVEREFIVSGDVGAPRAGVKCTNPLHNYSSSAGRAAASTRPCVAVRPFATSTRIGFV